MKSTRLRQSIRHTLLHRIVEGKLRGGEQLNELHLSKQLKVSRTPLREALLQLERDGFTRSDLRRGFSVERLSSRDVRETYPMLWTLEGLALRSSAIAAHLVVPDLIRINSKLAVVRQPDRAIELDAQWHETLISHSKNRRLSATIATLRLAVRRYELFYMEDTRLIAVSVDQHKKIIGALERHDVELAVKLLEPNWSFAMQVLLRMMGEEL